MTKLHDKTFTTDSGFITALQSLRASVGKFGRSLSSILPGGGPDMAEELPERLRYDIGTLDCRPSRMPGHEVSLDLDREIMRRWF